MEDCLHCSMRLGLKRGHWVMNRDQSLTCVLWALPSGLQGVSSGLRIWKVSREAGTCVEMLSCFYCVLFIFSEGVIKCCLICLKMLFINNTSTCTLHLVEQCAYHVTLFSCLNATDLLFYLIYEPYYFASTYTAKQTWTLHEVVNGVND